MKLDQVKAVISGGASGLGLATAQRLVAAGGRVTLLDVQDAAGNSAAGALGKPVIEERDVVPLVAADPTAPTCIGCAG